MGDDWCLTTPYGQQHAVRTAAHGDEKCPISNAELALLIRNPVVHHDPCRQAGVIPIRGCATFDL